MQIKIGQLEILQLCMLCLIIFVGLVLDDVVTVYVSNPTSKIF